MVDYNLKAELEHGIYVSRLAGDLALEMELEPEAIERIKLAGLVHDIGKLELQKQMDEEDRDDILITQELKFVRSHVELSRDILRADGYPEDVCEMAFQHHENYDGTGYPCNLKGEEILLGARIIRVCDVFAALSAERPYRRGFEIREVMDMMIDEIEHYDMDIFLRFQRLIHRIGTSRYFEFEEGENYDFD